MERDTETITGADVGEVEAVMTSANSGPWGFGKLVAQAVERAMADAVTTALADGIDIHNSEEIRARMLAARQAVLDHERQAQAVPATKG